MNNNIAYRSIFYTFVIALSIALFSGCESAGDEISLSGDDSIVGSRVSLVASQSGEESTRVENDLWESSDFIGVSTSDESEMNMCYMVESNGTMTNTDDDYVISVVGSKSYYAYYPYSNDLADDYIMSVDLSEQSTMSEDKFKSLDLMYSKQESVDASNPTVYLLFERKMVHIDVSLLIYGNTFDESGGITLSEVYTTGEFDIMTGSMVSTGSKSDLQLRVTSVEEGDPITLSDGTQQSVSIVTAEAYLIPMSNSSITFSYTSGSGNFSSLSFDSGSLVGGNNYKFIITEGVESYALDNISGSVIPAGNLWVISDSDPVVSSQFGGLQSALEAAGDSGISVSLLFLNLTELPSEALKGCTALVAVNIPDVTTINSYAFEGCSSLKYVEAPRLGSVAEYAFKGCSSLSSLSMESLTNVDDGAFSGCEALTALTFDNLESIGDSSFADCDGLTLFNAANISWVGSSAFAGCDALNKIILGNESTTGITNLVSGWVDSSRASSMQLTISPLLPSGVSVSGYTLSYADGTSNTFNSIDNQALTLSSFTTGMSASSLPETDYWVLMDSSASSSDSFAGLRYALNSLVSSSRSITLIFPSLTSLPSGALQNTNNFSSITAMSVSSIGSSALSGASSLTSVTLGSSGGTISSLVAGWITSAQSVTIDIQINSSLPSGVTIEDNLFCFGDEGDYSSLNYFKTINGVGLTLNTFDLIKSDPSYLPTTTEWYITESGTPEISAFDDLKTVLASVSSNITLIFSQLDGLPRGALSSAQNLYKVSLESATRIYYNALSSCTTLEIIDAPYVTTISDSAFSASINVKSISLPSAMVIGASLFRYMKQLESLDLGSETYVSLYDNECFESMFNTSTVTTLTICGRDKFTSDMSISDNELLFDTPDDKYNSQLKYSFKEIIEK